MNNFDIEAQNIEQRRRYAEALRSQSMEPISAGQLPGVPISPFQGLAKIFKAYNAGQAGKKAEEDSKNLSTQKNKALADALKRSREIEKGGATLNSDGSPNMVMPERSPDPQGASDHLISSGHPVAQQLGANMYDRQGKSQDRMAELQLKSKLGSESPSNVREWDFYNKLSPQEKENYLRMKRADKFLDVGSGFVTPSQVNPTQVQPVADRKLKPAEQLPYIEGKESAEAIGKAKGAAQMNLPQAVASASQSLNLIDQMIGSEDGKIKPHSGFQSAVGTTLIPGARFIDGSDTSNFMSLLDQVKGGAFLQAFESLKGGGQITQIEGEKATNAITRMGKSQSESEFKKAAREFQSVIKTGVERAKQKAGGVPATPDVGKSAVDALLEKYK